MELDPKFGLLYRDMALSLYNLERYDEAIEKLEKCIDLGMEKSIEKHAVNFLKILKNKKGEK